MTEKSGASVPHYNKSAEHLPLRNDNDAYESLHMLTVLSTLARKIRDFRTRKASPMVQIRCSRGFDTKKEAFACPNIPRQSVCSSQIFLIGPLSRSLINGRAVPMAERFCCRLPSDG